jgi:hypothetical protein
MLIRSHKEENLVKRDELWNYFAQSQPKMYKKIRNGIFGRAMNVKSPAGRKITEALYFIAQKLFGFN